jgi:hypothetical protein
VVSKLGRTVQNTGSNYKKFLYGSEYIRDLAAESLAKSTILVFGKTLELENEL